MYKISTGKNCDNGVEVNIEAPNPTGVPKYLAIGVGPKKAKYKAFLDKCINGNQSLLQFLAFIHKTGKEKGSIYLRCKCKSKDRFHEETVKEWLEEKGETLDMLLPYLFPDAGYKAKVTDVDGFTNKSIKSLSQDDQRQIMDLIKADQEKSTTSPV